MTANLFLFFSVPFLDFQHYLRFSLCHTFPLPFTITIHNFNYHPCLCLAHPLPHLCTSPGDTNLTPCPAGMSAPDPWGTVTIVRNAIGHRPPPPLELVIKRVESDVVRALMMTTAGGYTPNCLTSPTVITPGARCAWSMGHTSPLRLQLSCAPTRAHVTISCICRTACSNATPSKTSIGCSATQRQTMRTCDRTMPAPRKRTTS